MCFLCDSKFLLLCVAIITIQAIGVFLTFIVNENVKVYGINTPV